MNKQIGILCPVSCLVSPYGIGDFGKGAYEFVDTLYRHGLTVWQILPLHPLGYGHSPYQPLSAMAGEELYLDIEMFCQEGLLYDDERIFCTQDLFVDYENVRTIKEKMYKKAYSRFQPHLEFEEFIYKHPWVKNYALYRVFKEHESQSSWLEWKNEYKYYWVNKQMSLRPFDKDILYHMFLQYYFFKQWEKLRNYAHQKNITIIGDMPIYVGLDCADVWFDQKSFLLDEDGYPQFVAGVPPDYFSQYGQRWGNPLYDWDYLKQHHFYFWVDRMKQAMQLYDMIRIDHFRGFDTYWMIPSCESTAIHGKWQKAPGYELFQTLFEKLPTLSLLAEDLGELNDDVYQLRDAYHLKGMYVFQFHYQDHMDMNKVIVYTGTHDNDTLKGWISSLSVQDHEYLQCMLKDYPENDLDLKIIHYCMTLNADYIMIPIWDILQLDSQYRFNIPGQIGGHNWQFHLLSYQNVEESFRFLSHIIKEIR